MGWSQNQIKSGSFIISMRKKTYKTIKRTWGFLKNLFIVLAAMGTVVAISTSISSNRISKEANKTSKDALGEARKSNALAKSANVISEDALDEAQKSNKIADEANEISREISGITNRPYILYANANFAYGDFYEDNYGKKLKIFHNFTLINKGTLPAWVYDYSFYVSGDNNKPIHVPYEPKDKPSSNFTLGQNDGGESRTGWFSLMQKYNEKNGHVDSFLERQNKFILLITKYKTLGRELDDKDFAYWELFIFNDDNKTSIVEAETSLLTISDIENLFIKQDKRFRENNAI